MITLVKTLAFIVFSILFRVRLVGREKIPASGPALLCANHLSELDMFFIGYRMNRLVHWMAKEELFRNPLLKAIITKLGAFPVKRGTGDIGAIKTSLKLLKEPCEVTLCSDSQYVCNSISKGWAKAWKQNGWRKGDKKPALNADLWDELLGLLERHKVTIVWVKGHAGHPENERCDRLAVAGAEKAKNL
jgi:1-acyl-sn-glycerol-3-phosphate acyltransferase